MSETKEVAVKKSTAVALPEEMLGAFMEDSGAGTENIGADDMKIPFIRVLQPVSPQLKKKDGAHIPGAEAGDIFNTVTGQLWKSDDGALVIPCGYTKKFLEFGPYDQGGGFKGELAPNSAEVLSAQRVGNKDILENGNELVTSAQHYVQIHDPSTGTWQTGIIDMKSTNLKISRQWNTMIQMQQAQANGKTFKVPSFGCIWKLETDEYSNDMGSWNGWKISGREGYVEDADLYNACKEFSKMVSEGEVAAAADPDLEEVSTDSTNAPF